MAKHLRSRRAARRRGRVGILGVALGVTIAVGGIAVGVLPQLQADRAEADAYSMAPAESGSNEGPPASAPAPVPAPVQTPAPVDAAAPVIPDVPARSGDGRRIVFDQSDQRVWLLGDGNKIARTYLVSGSRLDNLQPGSYSVTSRSRRAPSYDYSSTLEYFVRFATGVSEPIGFHAVPRNNAGELEQTRAQLGTPLSAGCVRQWLPDAIALWDFAPIGTKVYVTA